MKNKLLNKYLMPCYISAGVFLGTAFFAGSLSRKTWNDAKKLPDYRLMDKYDRELLDSLSNIFFTSSFISLACLSAGVAFLIYGKKDASKKLNKLTAEYLQDVFYNHPSLKQYEPILKDTKKLQQIGNLICNSLTDHEQKQIIEIVNTMNSRLTDQISDRTEKAIIRQAETEIIAVVKDHARANPEFVQTILSLFANKHNTFIMTMNEKTR